MCKDEGDKGSKLRGRSPKLTLEGRDRAWRVNCISTHREYVASMPPSNPSDIPKIQQIHPSWQQFTTGPACPALSYPILSDCSSQFMSEDGMLVRDMMTYWWHREACWLSHYFQPNTPEGIPPFKIEQDWIKDSQILAMRGMTVQCYLTCKSDSKRSLPLTVLLFA